MRYHDEIRFTEKSMGDDMVFREKACVIELHIDVEDTYPAAVERKGSSCSTPISATVRSEYDYPSQNFIRSPRGDPSKGGENLSFSSGVSIEEGPRLTIRLHYNPVMDEWVSLTDERNRQSTLSVLYSATTGDLTALKRLYFVDADMMASNYDRRTALHLAACEGHADCVKFLVEKCKISPLVKDRWGFTPIEEAKRFQHDLVFRYLAKYAEDHYPTELENLLNEQEKAKKL